jgi:hypothetical protein
MAAPIYSQAEADAMIAMEKRIEVDAWEKRGSGRASEVDTPVTIDARPENGDVRINFKIEMLRNDRNDTFAISLKGKIEGRPWECFCRYEIQNLDHENDTRCCKPSLIPAGAFHCHLYSERSYEVLDRWDGCAELLDLPTDGSFDQQLTRLRWRFVNDMRIRFSDSGTVEGLFGKEF